VLVYAQTHCCFFLSEINYEAEREPAAISRMNTNIPLQTPLMSPHNTGLLGSPIVSFFSVLPTLLYLVATLLHATHKGGQTSIFSLMRKHKETFMHLPRWV